MRFGLGLWLLVSSCVPATRDVPARPAPLAVSAPQPEVHTGQLVTYKAGKAVGLEEYRDDGDRVRSRVQLGSRRYEIELSRSTQTVRCDGHVQHLDADTVALENGNWQAYAVAAARFGPTQTSRPVKVLLPCSGLRLDGTFGVLTQGDDRWAVLQI